MSGGANSNSNAVVGVRTPRMHKERCRRMIANTDLDMISADALSLWEQHEETVDLTVAHRLPLRLCIPVEDFTFNERDEKVADMKLKLSVFSELEKMEDDFQTPRKKTSKFMQVPKTVSFGKTPPPPLSELVEVTHELRASHAPAAHIALAKALASLPAAQPRASKRTAQQEKELQAIKDKETMEKWQKIKDKQLPNNKAHLMRRDAMMLNGLALDLGNGATSTWRPGQTTWTLRQPL